MLSVPLSLLLPLLAATLRGIQNVRADGDRVETYLSQVLDALSKLVEFYEDSVEDMNLDGFFGARLTEAQLKGYLKSLEDQNLENSLLEDYLKKTSALQKRFQDIADKGQIISPDLQPEYYESMGFLLQKNRWERFYSFRNLKTSPLPSESRVTYEAIEESVSDNCIGEELFHQECQISQYCWSRMTKPGYIRYSLTHQILYLIIAYEFGCKSEVKNLASSVYNETVDQLQESMCSNCFQEATAFAKEEFHKEDRDIFIEQIAICGYLGYTDFLQFDWLEDILEWQKPNGCFEFKHTDTGRRKKRENWYLTDGCATHATAVTAGALAQYLKFLLHEAIESE